MITIEELTEYVGYKKAVEYVTALTINKECEENNYEYIS